MNTKEKIESIEKVHNESPHLRILQKTIAEEVTIRVHGKEALDAAIVASTILFGKSTSTDLRKLTDEQFLGEDNEWLIIYSKQKATEIKVDYFIFGHRHFAIDLKINDTTRYINLGDWIRLYTYGVFDGETMQLLEWKKSQSL